MCRLASLQVACSAYPIHVCQCKLHEFAKLNSLPLAVWHRLGMAYINNLENFKCDYIQFVSKCFLKSSHLQCRS